MLFASLDRSKKPLGVLVPCSYLTSVGLSGSVISRLFAVIARMLHLSRSLRCAEVEATNSALSAVI